MEDTLSNLLRLLLFSTAFSLRLFRLFRPSSSSFPRPLGPPSSLLHFSSIVLDHLPPSLSALHRPSNTTEINTTTLCLLFTHAHRPYTNLLRVPSSSLPSSTPLHSSPPLAPLRKWFATANHRFEVKQNVEHGRFAPSPLPLCRG